MPAFIKAHHMRHQDFTDGAGVGGAIGVAAHPRIHRAVVHAGAAANAAQGVQQLVVLIDGGTAIVHQHHVNLFRAVHLVGLAGAGNHIEVGGNVLAGGGTGQ